MFNENQTMIDAKRKNCFCKPIFLPVLLNCRLFLSIAKLYIHCELCSLMSNEHRSLIKAKRDLIMFIKHAWLLLCCAWRLNELMVYAQRNARGEQLIIHLLNLYNNSHILINYVQNVRKYESFWITELTLNI